MHCQTGWAISDYTNLSRYHTCSLQLSQCTEGTKHNDARLTCTSGLCIPTFLWNAKVGSHRNPANCSVGKEVVITSCQTWICCAVVVVTSHTHTDEKDLTFTNMTETEFSFHVFKWIVIVDVIRPHWDWSIAHLMDSWMSTASLHYIQMRQTSEELPLTNLPLSISFHEPLQLHTHALRLRRDYIRKIMGLRQSSTVLNFFSSHILLSLI